MAEESFFEEITNIILNYLVDAMEGLGMIESAFILVLVMILQAIIAPIISEAILASAGATFYRAFGTVGLYTAIIAGIIGSLLGAVTAFYIARWFQKQVKLRIVDGFSDEVEITGETRWQRLKSRFRRFMNRVSAFLARFIDEDSDDFIEIIEKRGFLIVLIGRILVFVPFDAVSYAAGFTKIKFKDFLIATTIGTIPRVIFYILLGAQLSDVLGTNFELFVVLFGVIAGGIFGLYKWTMRYLKNKNNQNEEKQQIDIEIENSENN